MKKRNADAADSNRLMPMGSSADLQPGRYRHYKGKDYIVLGVARHSETQEAMVVYRQDYGDRGLWVRPLAVFEETVLLDERVVQRFEYVGPEDG